MGDCRNCAIIINSKGKVSVKVGKVSSCQDFAKEKWKFSKALLDQEVLPE